MAPEDLVPASARQRPEAARARQAIDLTEQECWRLLGTASLGRIVFTLRAMPAIRPVNHLVDDGQVIVRSHLGAAIVAHAADGGAVVCYEADDLDPARHTGWSVIVTGMARLVTDPELTARYRAALEPWIAVDMDHVLAIRPHVITGIQLVGWCS